METGEFDEDRAVKVLGHPVRIRILQLLADKGPLSWKDMSKGLGIGTGTLYHHLDMLERMVEQDSAKRYRLTDVGKKVIDFMNARPSGRDPATISKIMERKSALSSLEGAVIPRSFISSLTASRRRAVMSTAGVSMVVLAAVFVSQSRVFLLAFFPTRDVLLSAGSLGLSLLVMGLILYSGARLIGSRPDPLVTLFSVALSLVPLAAFSLLLKGLASASALGILGSRDALTFAFAIFQTWGACVAGAGLSVASGLRVERGLLVSLTLLYLTILVVFAQGQSYI